MEQEVISLSEAEESLDEAGAPGPHSDDDIAIDDPGEFATTKEYLAVSRANPTDITRVHILTFFLGHQKCTVDDCEASNEAAQIRNRAREPAFRVQATSER